MDVRGRSSTLTVNYRTSHQIRRTADRLLPGAVRDVDGEADERGRTVSVFNGPQPEVREFDVEAAEIKAVAAWLRQAADEAVLPQEMGIFVRTRAELPRAIAVAEAAGLAWVEVSERSQDNNNRISIGTMHLAKGLEFKVAAVMACDEAVLPLQARLQGVADETELDEVYETERHLLYVACTRARDRLMITGVRPTSEFLQDLKTSGDW